MKIQILLSVSFFTVSLSSLACDDLGRKILKTFNKKYETDGKVLGSKPIFIGPDALRKQLSISLTEVVKVKEPTDIQFPPAESPFMFILEKAGDLILFDREKKTKRVLHKFPVITDSEEGLLGFTFHPNYPKEPKVYSHTVISSASKDMTVIAEWLVENPNSYESMVLKNERVLLQVEQPYPNHNGGQIGFGPDGYLYIGLGDGGWRADPKNNGQNPNTLLGSILRISPMPDVDGKKPYSIPKDNPFLGKQGFLPEIFAFGIRNPWKMSFSPDGRLIVADVGQDAYEEVDVILSGKNYGWNQTEGFHCFTDGCNPSLYQPPFYEYGREEGQSITGGYVYTGSSIPELKGKYVFGDFIQGKIWAIEVPKPGTNQKSTETIALGKWNLLIPTFGKDNDGEIFVADYQSGTIYKLGKP
ncbi:dehydrogenase [Leptospira levettii]|uniref:PQQ-dependent sugar dehydrogenase n=1 Tax=Leptospira levettii TaxID=2023178 RepID=UPI00109239E4|nr:PQQ-dependent sugar dehydrogenase [Leptospira levettii]TGM77260.1 dehydrogenase [Leptospira levettii]